jgi:hypothetical protein
MELQELLTPEVVEAEQVGVELVRVQLEVVV